MAQCIRCNLNIPDGAQLCDNCSSQEEKEADEIYLDNLLNSIMPSDDAKDVNKKRKQENNEQHETEIRNIHTWDNKTEDGLVKPIPKDYNIFSTSDNDAELDFLNSLFGNTEENESEELMSLGMPEELNGLSNEPEEPFHIDRWEELGSNSPMEEVTKGEDQYISEDDIEVLPEQEIEQASSNDKEEEAANMKDAYDFSDNDLDLLDLINEINNIEELPQEEEPEILQAAFEEMKEPEDNLSMDIADIYADALSAVTSLDDTQLEEDLLDMIAITDESETIRKEAENINQESILKNKKNKKNSNTNKKASLLKRVFGNIKEDISQEELEARKQKVIEEGKKKEQEKLKLAEELKANKARMKAEKAEKAKKAKDDAARKKAEAVAKAKAKKEEKEKHSREIQELIDDINENEGKINKVGASIVFVFFAAAAIVIVIGTNVYNYAINIKNAQESFSRKLYDDAYQKVYGIEVKDEDEELYDKIMTVMYVNKQLNSYNNFLNMKQYPEALDSLLKGLERYEKYYMLASLHGIEDDLDYVKDHIIEELDETFLLSEEEARAILAYEDQIKYSMAVYELANEYVEEELTRSEQADTDNNSKQDSSTDTQGKKGN